MDFAVALRCFFLLAFNCPSTLRSPAPHAMPMPMPNVPSGPLLFVIGTPNVAALHWRGCWQKSSDQAASGQPYLL
jgi:hypothetical protein